MVENCNKCGRQHYKNDLQKIEAGGIIYTLGPECHGQLIDTLSNKAMIKAAMTLGEWQRLRDERRSAYARAEVGVADA